MLFLLQTYAAQEGPYQAKAQTIYKELRRNVVDNVVKVGCPLFMFFFPFSCSSNQEFERTGYAWEQYDAMTGEGRRRYAKFICRCVNISLTFYLFFTIVKSPIHWMDIINRTE